VPVDPAIIAGLLGLRVVEVELDGDVAGALMKEPDRDPIIFLNVSDHRNRKRFTCAHEVGHFVRHTKADPDKFEYIDFRDSDSSSGTRDEEIYANEFAAALLMPEAEMRRLDREKRTDLEMSWLLGVSRGAVQFRLKNLKLPVR
jgi:Zn-dependent peptidase ImmA (M78 family)